MLASLSHRNMKRQLSEYKIFWFSLVGVVALMYAFNSLIVSRTMQQLFRLFAESGNGDIGVIATLFSAVVVFALGWFISYMMDFILQRRSKEISTYMVLGVEKSDICKIIIVTLCASKNDSEQPSYSYAKNEAFPKNALP